MSVTYISTPQQMHQLFRDAPRSLIVLKVFRDDCHWCERFKDQYIDLANNFVNHPRVIFCETHNDTQIIGNLSGVPSTVLISPTTGILGYVTGADADALRSKILEVMVE